MTSNLNLRSVYLQQPPEFQRPQVYLIGVFAARGNELRRRVDGDAAELGRVRGRERLEVAVADEVSGAHGAVERGRDDGAAALREGDPGHGPSVVREGDVAEG